MERSKDDDDRELLNRIWEDLDAHFNEFLEKYQGPIRKYIYAKIQSQEDAKDICQEVFSNAYLSLKRRAGDENHQYVSLPLKSWIYVIAKNACINFLERRKVRERFIFPRASDEQDFWEAIHDQERLPEEQMLLEEEIKESYILLGQLPSDLDIDIILLHYKFGLQYSDISEILERPLNTIKSRSRRSKDLLQKIKNKQIYNVSKLQALTKVKKRYEYLVQLLRRRGR